jgi:hypothetical protein
MWRLTPANAQDVTVALEPLPQTGAVYADRGYDAMALPRTVLRRGDLGSRNPQKAVCRFL